MTVDSIALRTISCWCWIVASQASQPDLTDVCLIWSDAALFGPHISEEKFQCVPADFIAEGDQTCGVVHTPMPAAMVKERCFEERGSKRLVLDKNGNKIPKRLGNADPFQTIEKQGSIRYAVHDY